MGDGGAARGTARPAGPGGGAASRYLCITPLYLLGVGLQPCSRRGEAGPSLTLTLTRILTLTLTLTRCGPSAGSWRRQRPRPRGDKSVPRQRPVTRRRAATSEEATSLGAASSSVRPRYVRTTTSPPATVMAQSPNPRRPQAVLCFV
eukprot:scaffold92946_cov54-Phaeocystis_antarctica.AAC.2